ncbi:MULTISPECIES: helix-turn-helix domain-containing protein [unclassified Sphingomonas]|uniref:helix-turn-helix domain-containing protein n=1 Tax=unclassified Sphingomonas TaxID=196159 RepID=UPI0009E946E8|nr:MULTISPECIES: helix-turn-helix domain-containing protein [unclassified Sphingomonas]
MNKTSAPTKGGRSITPLTISVNDALAMLGIGRTRFYELVAAGEIATIKLGRRRLVQVASLQRLASEGYDPPPRYVKPEQLLMNF